MTQQKSQDSPGKKPYESPQMVEYGDIIALTRAVGTNGQLDGGGGTGGMMGRTST